MQTYTCTRRQSKSLTRGAIKHRTFAPSPSPTVTHPPNARPCLNPVRRVASPPPLLPPCSLHPQPNAPWIAWKRSGEGGGLGFAKGGEEREGLYLLLRPCWFLELHEMVGKHLPSSTLSFNALCPPLLVANAVCDLVVFLSLIRDIAYCPEGAPACVAQCVAPLKRTSATVAIGKASVLMSGQQRAHWQNRQTWLRRSAPGTPQTTVASQRN